MSRRVEPGPVRGFYFLLVPVLGLLLLTRGFGLFDLLSLNLTVAQVVPIRVGLQGAESSMLLDALGKVSNCHASWYEGLVAQSVGDNGGRNKYWIDAFRCSPSFILLASARSPHDRVLAEQAVELQPDSADAWFWLASATSNDPQAAIEYLRRGLTLRPADGLHWRQLGDLLVEQDPRAAMEAYVQSCEHGDPGLNGCSLAGTTAQQMGDLESALKYLRLSRWPRARQLADELERQMAR